MSLVHTFTSSVLGPHARGLEFGERYGVEIAATTRSYRRLFDAVAPRSFDLDRWAESAWQTIDRLAPDAAAEISGMAAGSGLPVSDIAALNARTELLAMANPTGVEECSSVVCLPRGSAATAVQTWDWYAAMADGWLHWTIPHPDGHVVQTVTEFGILGKIGVSSRGFGVLFNMLHHERDGTGDLGVPLHLISRYLLDEAANLEEALAIIGSVRTSASTALTLVEAHGQGGRADRTVSVELFPEGIGLVYPLDGVLVRTNHFLSSTGRPGCTADAIGLSSHLRRGRLLVEIRRPVPADSVLAAMDDHADPGGVCVHPDPAADPVLQHATLATVTLDPAAHSLSVMRGGPCGSGSVRAVEPVPESVSAAVPVDQPAT